MLRTRFARPGLVVLPLCAMIAAAFAGVAPGAKPDDRAPLAAAAPRSAQAKPPPAEKPKPCTRPVALRLRIQDDDSADPPDAHCGSRWNDRVVARGGHDWIEVYANADYIDAANGKGDEIYGGVGVNRGVFDRCDRVYDFKPQNIQLRGGPCQEIRPSRSQARAAVDYPYFLATVECKRDAQYGNMIRFAEAPTMRARDTSALVDWQFVSWSAILYQWNGATWVAVEPAESWQTTWLWDRTYDQQVAEFPGNFWRRFVTNDRWFTWFQHVPSGTYRVAISYHWYATPTSPAHDELQWAGPHYGEFEEHPGHRWCVIP